MRDGVALARMNIPGVVLVTEKFWPQGEFVARSIGMPDVPMVKLPHPVAGSGTDAMERVAADIVGHVISRLASTS